MLTKTDLQDIKTIVQEEIKTGLKPVKAKLNKVDKKVSSVILHFDKRVTKLENEFKALEQN